MASEETLTPANSQSSSSDMPSFSDTVFGFLDENYPSSENSSDYTFEESEWGDVQNEGEDEELCVNFENNKTFWDEQEKLISGILCRTTSIESKVRNVTKEGLKKLMGRINCDCSRDFSDECRNCLRQAIFDHLCNAGFCCIVQKSKWKSSQDIPSGEHTYLEVVDKSIQNKGEIKVIIELNFRAEFEMAKASQEYNKLVRKLPQVYVGKRERLRNMVKILCGAAKKCTNDKKVHLAPWRKNKYMQAKWLNSCVEFVLTKTNSTPTMTTKYTDRRLGKPKSSMLTQSLIKGLSVSHRQIVEVI